MVSRTDWGPGGGGSWVRSSRRGALIPRGMRAGANGIRGPASRAGGSQSLSAWRRRGRGRAGAGSKPGGGAGPGRGIPALGPPISSCRGSVAPGRCDKAGGGEGRVALPGGSASGGSSAATRDRGRGPRLGAGPGRGGASDRVTPASLPGPGPLKWRRRRRR